MKTVYMNGIILDGTKDMVPQENLLVFTDGDKIEKIEPAVGKAADGKAGNAADCADYAGYKAQGYEVVDLKGQYLMPGLVNLHVHLPASGKPKKKQQDNVKMVRLMTSNGLLCKVARNMCEGYAKTQLMSGVTTIRTMGGILDFDAVIRERIASGAVDGPRILASNMAISVPGGHMAGSLAYEAGSAEEARSLVAKIAEGKPDVIKLMITGGVLDAKVKGEPGELKMPAEYVKAACEEAHKRGFKVAAHVESPEGVRVALENGVDTIEHGAKPDEEIIELFKSKKACHIATLSPALPYALFDRAVSRVSETEQYNGKVVFDGIIDCAAECLKNDIPVGLGTDTGCPYITQYDMWRELYYFHKYCGVSNTFALYTATKRNAELAGLGDVTGTIEAGKCADFVVTKENPLENLAALRKISMVVARGKRFQNPKVKKMEEVERELDKFVQE